MPEQALGVKYFAEAKDLLVSCKHIVAELQSNFVNAVVTEDDLDNFHNLLDKLDTLEQLIKKLNENL